MFRGNSRPSPYYPRQRPLAAGHQHRQHPAGHNYRHQARPHFNPRAAAPTEVVQTMEESVYQDRVCKWCSDSSHTERHHHVSSEAVREFAKQNNKYLFSCTMCRQMESVVRPSTRKLILTTSTLFNVWTQSSFKPDIHMEIEAVVGGRIRDLTRALMMLYLGRPERLELILIAGLNNIGDSQPVPDILDEICELKEAVQAHSIMHNHSPASIVSISTVLYAPKFCSLDVPNGFPEWLAPPGFNNRRRDIECLNAAIAALNKGAGVNWLNLHYEGVRFDSKSGKKFHKHNPVKPIWRETNIRRRLHLTPEYKVRVANMAAKLFKGGLTRLGDWNQPRLNQ